MVKFVITGPESTGKTSIAGQLGLKFSIPVINEFAVDYLKKSGGKYNYTDLLKIARGQIRSEEKLINDINSEYLLCDTDLITIKIWSMVKYKKVNKEILAEIEKRHYDHYILCYPDIEWEYSEFRENPNDRDVLYRLYEEELKFYNKNYSVLTGKGDERIENAYKIFNKMLVDNL
jgi:nicotinamide riboside kinase